MWLEGISYFKYTYKYIHHTYRAYRGVEDLSFIRANENWYARKWHYALLNAAPYFTENKINLCNIDCTILIYFCFFSLNFNSDKMRFPASSYFLCGIS